MDLTCNQGTRCHTSSLPGLRGAATFESSILDLALAQPSCWNMGSNDETRLPSLTWSGLGLGVGLGLGLRLGCWG